jgi:hypothetical protein
MPEKPGAEFTAEDAKAVIRRYSLTKLGPDQVEPLRAAMQRIALAGLAVPRVASKFDAPAPVFRVPVSGR